MKNNRNYISSKKTSTEDEENTIKGAYEMPSEGDGYDSNLEVHSTRENKNKTEITAKAITRDKKESNQIVHKAQNGLNEDKLRHKITEQAQRLTGLETYKALCEQRIRQLAPGHNIPVKETDLRADPKYKNINQYYNSVIEGKDREIEELKKRLGANNNCISNYNSLNSCQGKIIPENIDKLPVDKVKVAYYSLLNYYSELNEEKEQILESLRNETILNEEQRNYIEILRQTLESSIIKHGMTTLLHSIKTSTGQREMSDLDLVIDISRMKQESDKSRKELVMAQVLVNELKQEVEFMKKTNEDISIRKEKIRESLDNGLRELEQAKDQVENLEKEKEEVVNFSEGLRTQNKKLAEDLDKTNLTNKKYENEIHECNRRLCELQIQLDNQYTLQNTFNEYKKSFEKLYGDFQTLLKEKSNFEIDNEHLKADLKHRVEEVTRLRQVLEEKEDKYELDRKTLFTENDELIRGNKKLERLSSESSISVKEKEKEIKKLEEKWINLERSLSGTKSKLEELQDDAEAFKTEAERRQENDQKIIREQNKNLYDMKTTIENMTLDKQTIFDDYVTAKNQCDKLDSELRRFITDNREKEKSLDNLNDQYENLYREFYKLEDSHNILLQEKENLNQDLTFFKDKYEKDVNNKNAEVLILNKEIFNKSNEIDSLSKNKDVLESQIEKLEDQIRLDNSELRNLQLLKEDLNRKLEKTSSDLQRQTQNNKELNNNNHNLHVKFEDLTRSLNCLQEEKEKIESNRNRLTEDLEILKKSEKEAHLKILNLNQTLQEIKNSIISVISSVKNHLGKFNLVIEKSQHCLFSSNFVDLVKRLDALNTKNLNNIKETIKQLEDSVRVVFSEAEILHDMDQSLNVKVSSLQERNQLLEQKLRSLELSDEEKSTIERKLRNSLQELTEEKNALRSEKEDLEKRQERILRENKSIRNEVQKIEELNKNKEETLSRQCLSNDNLVKEMKNKEHQVNMAKFQVEALEERIVILVKEKKYSETLLNRVSKAHPDREMQRIVNEIMNINDDLAQSERDRVRIEDNLIHMDETAISKSFSKERENLKSLTYEYDRKIQEMKESIRLLENEMRNIEIQEKNTSNTLYEYDYKVKVLQKELTETKEELRKFKMMSLNTFKTSESDVQDLSYSNVDKKDKKDKKLDNIPSRESTGFDAFERKELGRLNYSVVNKTKSNTGRSFNIREPMSLRNTDDY